MYSNSFPTSQKTQTISSIANLFILFTGAVVYSKLYETHKETFWAKGGEYNIKSGGTNNYHSSLTLILLMWRIE
jgi:hypothetical protein